MTAKLSFFPVGNGDMTLMETSEGKKILIDTNIRSGDEYPDVLGQLREKLQRDAADRLFVDLFIWTHPDEDHCRGIEEHFHLGAPEEWSSEKDLIFIKGIWSSPIVFKRANSKENHTLCSDAVALNREVKRRVNLYKQSETQNEGNFVLVLGDDEDGKTDDIQNIVLQLDSRTSDINCEYDSTFTALLLGPSPISEHDEEEQNLGKNHSSAIINFELRCGSNTALFLNGGDAEVVCWETLIRRLRDTGREDDLAYDILQAPHHCSWHTLSHDSLKDLGHDAKTSDEAMEALGKAQQGAHIISSSNEIKDDDNNPPAYRAKEEYLSILGEKQGFFYCVADHKKQGKNVPLVIEISSSGSPRLIPATGLAASINAHESNVNKKGGDGYA